MQTEINFYNTIPLVGTELMEARESAATQADRIERFFKENSCKEFTPFMVQEKLGMHCINSVRRAMTNLSKKGILIKTGNMVIERFGVKNNLWKLN